IEAVCAVRDIKYIQLYNRTYRKAVTFAEAVQHKYPSINIEIMEAVNDAITNADIIVTATNAVRPVFSQLLKSGFHVNAVCSFKPDKQELHTQAIANANKIVVEASQTALEETDDLITPLKEGLFSQEDLYCELGHIVKSNLPGRES